MGGGGWSGSMRPQGDSDSIPAIHAALDHGMRWIDTAALYGLGHSEEIVRALAPGSTRPYGFTKCERVCDDQGRIGVWLKASSVRRECEASLRRLKSDVIDLFQIHWPEPDEDIGRGMDRTCPIVRGRKGSLHWRLAFQRLARKKSCPTLIKATSVSSFTRGCPQVFSPAK
jgi:aryl-alcohol dehydrogenase-like predicted oxidoreductase